MPRTTRSTLAFPLPKVQISVAAQQTETPSNAIPEKLDAPDPNVWTRSMTLALAQQSCSHCYGLGQRPGRADTMTPCNCVFRAIFRAVYARFRQCTSKEKYISRVSLESNPGRQRKSVWGLKNEEFIADFCLTARRALSDEQHKLFKWHFLLGADWKLCIRKLGCDRGEFFHEVYRIEQRLGRVFGELTPYALFPVDEYFSSGCHRRGTVKRQSPMQDAESLFKRSLKLKPDA